jgi:hypothetical protein
MTVVGTIELRKWVVVALLLIAGGVAGGWYFYHQWRGTPITELLRYPRQYEVNLVSIRGKVVDRTSLLVLKYFTVRDEKGEIKVVTERSLPVVGEIVRVKGRIREALAIGNSGYVVFMEEPERPR